MLLQDSGVPFPSNQHQLYIDNPAKSKTRHVRFGGRLYNGIWRIAKQIHREVLKPKRDSLVPKMSKNDSDPVRYVGQAILELRYSVLRDDLFTAAADSVQMKLAQSEEYCDTENYFFLSQRELLTWILNKWSNTMDDMKRTTEDDRLRVIGILFMEDMVEFIPYFLAGKDPANRLSLDEWTGKRNRAIHTVHMRFIDSDVVIDLPEEWLAPAAAEKIDSHYQKKNAPGFEEVYSTLNYNPNNLDRISLPWNKEELVPIISTSLFSYNAMMRLYTSGTGGGDGDPVVYSVWQNRGALTAVTYSSSRAKIYLSIIHIWDKNKSWPLTSPKGSVPDRVGVDDNTDILNWLGMPTNSFSA